MFFRFDDAPPLNRTRELPPVHLKPPPSLLTRAHKKLLWVLLIAIGVATIVIISLTVSLTNRKEEVTPKHQREEEEKEKVIPKHQREEEKISLKNRKRVKELSVRKNELSAAIRKEQPAADERKTVDNRKQISQIQPNEKKEQQAFVHAGKCPSGWHEGDGNCERNALFPNPVDPSMMDDSGNTPYRVACGAYANDKRNVGRDSAFLYTYHNNRQLMQDIATSGKSPLVSAFMDSCVQDLESADSEEFEMKTGKKSLVMKVLFARIESMESLDEVPEVMGLLHQYDTALPIELSFELDLLDGKRLVPLVRQSGIFANSLNELKGLAHATQVTRRFYYSGSASSIAQAAQMAKDVVNIELTLASAQHPSDSTNILSYVNEYARNDLAYDWESGFALTMKQYGFDFFAFLANSVAVADASQWLLDLKARPMWTYSPEYMIRFAQLHRSHDVSAWKNYFKHAALFNLVNDDSPHIDPDLHYAYHRNYESRYSLPWYRPRRFLTVAPSRPDGDVFSPREHESALEQCAFVCEAYLPIIMDDFFLHARLSQTLRDKAKNVLLRVQAEFVSELEKSEGLFSYFDSETKQKALDKVKAMHFIVGAPEHWEEREDRTAALAHLLSRDATFTDNMLQIRAFHIREQAALYQQHVRSGAPIDRDRLFDGMVSTVNAFYHHQLNTIMISAGLLQPPVFSEHYDEEAWFARLGVFVGHEMSHALDTIGVNFDGDGSVVPWISKSEAAAYDAHNRNIISMYAVTTELGNRHDGLKTLNENIADQIGFRMALSAALKSDSFSPGEFFLSYAQIYCEAVSKADEKRMIAKQTHSTGCMRVDKVLLEQPEFRDWWETRRAV